ncbi:hypothetical protein [Mesorhizobium sp. SP-1A]|jgi:hypothetical protein|uniref:hypothetical protein n=1 Tax=Mesorhizobium sp. SP-1A TaxID=3077840 RepID=UPI0028F6D49D|nr:hypothetical protein [Mesorhizobium sp. SP-1A]
MPVREKHDSADGLSPTLDFEKILLLIGRLNYTWTNTESLLIYLIAGLARVDKETAIVIFLTLNTTRARMDLVERLAKLPKTPDRCREDVLALLERLNQQSKLRNKYSHCIYSFDDKGEISHTQLMRIFDGKDSIKYGKIEAVDRAEITRITDCIHDIADVNRRIWQIVRENGFPQ